VLTEALACGTPAVAANVGSVPEIMVSEENLGICVENENIGEFISALQKVLLNPYDRKLSANKFSKYTWDWCAQKVMEVINAKTLN